MRILSIDPGLGVTGFSVLETKNKKFDYLLMELSNHHPLFHCQTD